jgi:ABC-2 type transport system permease protein
MRPVAAIVLKDLGQRIRDRSAVSNGLIAPLLLTVLMSLAFGRGETKFHATFAVVDADGGTVARSFVTDVLGGEGLRSMIKVRSAGERAGALKLLDDGKADAAFLIPKGFSTAVNTGGTATIAVLRSGSAPFAGQVAESVALEFASHVNATRLAVESAVGAGAPASAVPTILAELSQSAPVLKTAELGASQGDQKMATQFAPAMGVFFLYFVAGLGARSLLSERASGTFVRLLAAPVSALTVLGGKVIATFLLEMMSLATMVVASSLLLGADWGPLPAAAAVIVAIAFAVTAITACILTFARTERQVGFGMSMVTFGMALLGGNFVSLARAPDALRRLSLITPNGWALRAFGDLADGGGPGVILGPIGAIVAFGLVTGTVAVLRSGQVLRT